MSTTSQRQVNDRSTQQYPPYSTRASTPKSLPVWLSLSGPWFGNLVLCNFVLCTSLPLPFPYSTHIPFSPSSNHAKHASQPVSPSQLFPAPAVRPSSIFSASLHPTATFSPRCRRRVWLLPRTLYVTRPKSPPVGPCWCHSRPAHDYCAQLILLFSSPGDCISTPSIPPTFSPSRALFLRPVCFILFVPSSSILSPPTACPPQLPASAFFNEPPDQAHVSVNHNFCLQVVHLLSVCSCLPYQAWSHFASLIPSIPSAASARALLVPFSTPVHHSSPTSALSHHCPMKTNDGANL